MNPNSKYQFATELPKDYNGTLHFTNFSDDVFQARWANVEYTFPAKSTIPLVIPTLSPIETFNVRTRFAKELADREFKKSKRAGQLNEMNKNANGLRSAVSYTENDLDSFIKRCLEPLPIVFMKSEKVQSEGEKRPKAKVAKIVKDSKYADPTDSGDTDTLVTGQGDSLA